MSRRSSSRGGGIFSIREVEYLESLPAVDRVVSGRIIYSDAFKRECIRRYRAGESPVEIFRRSGLDSSLIGYKRIERCVARWKKSERLNSGSGTVESSRFDVAPSERYRSPRRVHAADGHVEYLDDSADAPLNCEQTTGEEDLQSVDLLGDTSVSSTTPSQTASSSSTHTPVDSLPAEPLSATSRQSSTTSASASALTFSSPTDSLSSLDDASSAASSLSEPPISDSSVSQSASTASPTPPASPAFTSDSVRPTHSPATTSPTPRQTALSAHSSSDGMYEGNRNYESESTVENYSREQTETLDQAAHNALNHIPPEDADNLGALDNHQPPAVRLSSEQVVQDSSYTHAYLAESPIRLPNDVQNLVIAQQARRIEALEQENSRLRAIIETIPLPAADIAAGGGLSASSKEHSAGVRLANTSPLEGFASDDKAEDAAEETVEDVAKGIMKEMEKETTRRAVDEGVAA